ncbi:MAG: FHA domain-containing protein [Myxococcota bacterium]
MRVRLTEIRLRPTGKKVRLERDVDVESLFIGRGPDNDLSLKGLTISLHQATIRMSEGRVYIESASGQEINVNGLVTNGERLAVGDKVKLGSWELRVLEPDVEDEVDVALEYEETDRGDSERAALDARTHLGVEVGALARRPLSWAGIALVLAGFLALPLLWPKAQSPWSTGDVSRGHAYVESDCQACHSGMFKPVANNDCMTCHHDIGRHAPSEIQMAELDDASCASCHLEHRGREVNLADLGSGFCSDCHSDLSAEVPATELRNASDFGEDHPPFQLALVTDPVEEAVSVDVVPGLVENSGLTFNHLKHVGKAVSGRGDSKQFLQCGACHQPDAGGLYMEPVNFEDHCEDCHRLDFGKRGQTDFAPHGDPAALRKEIRGFYATRVVNGDVRDPKAPRRLRIRRPGSTLSSEEASLSKAWVESKLAAAERRFYEQPGTCVTCHTLDPGAASDGGMGIAPVQVQDIWVPGSVFSHGSHAPFACVKCHPAAGVYDPDPDTDLERPAWSMADSIPYELIPREAATPVSTESSDILIPAIDTCRECHSGANSWGGETVPSPCSMCHPFHIRELGPMSTGVESVSAKLDGAASGSAPAEGEAEEEGGEAEPSEAVDDADSDSEQAGAGHRGHPAFAINPAINPRVSVGSVGSAGGSGLTKAERSQAWAKIHSGLSVPALR